MQSEKNKLISGNIHSTRKRKRQLHTMEQGLFWNHVNWNWRYVQPLIAWMFIQLFFTMKLALQTAQLHHSSPEQLLERAVDCTMHGAYFEPWIYIYIYIYIYLIENKIAKRIGILFKGKYYSKSKCSEMFIFFLRILILELW